MPEFDVEIEGKGRKPRKEGKGPFTLLLMLLRRALAQPLVLFAAGLAGSVYFAGTPNLRIVYTCNGSLHSGGGCKFSYYSCVYYGVQGQHIILPDYDEDCPLVRFFPVVWGEESADSSGLPRSDQPRIIRVP